MKVLHLYDLYLPHTMNWAYRMMRAVPDTRIWAAAPWMVRNEYFNPDIRFFVRPLQRFSGWIPETEWKNFWFSSRLIRSELYWPTYRNWLLRQLKNDRPDVLHAHFAPVGYRYLSLAEKLDIPLVVSFYGYDYESLIARKPVWKERYKQIFQRAASVTCLGDHGREVLMKQGCPPAKIAVVPMNIHPIEFPFAEREKIAGRLRLVQVATITEKKGYLDTLRAVQLVMRDCPNVHLTIAGEKSDGHLVKKMHHFIHSNGLEDKVTWLDFFAHDALPAFFRQFDVFIHPSHYTRTRDSEGAPAVILEAQATGLPVISTFHADIPSEVVQGKTGLLSRENDPDTLAAHIRRFYWMEDEEYQSFSHVACQYVEENFDVKNTALQLRALYDSLSSPTLIP